MAELIECRECTSPYCRGCNLYILSRALHDGKFNGLMNANKLVVVPEEIAPVRHGRWVVVETEHGWNCAEYPTRLMCSECKAGIGYEAHGTYCPNCGAQMKGD